MKLPLSMIRFVLGAALLACLSGACGDDNERIAPASPQATPTGTPEAPIELQPLHAEPDPVLGGRIVDAEGREVLLRGVNVNALVEYWQGSEFPTTFPLTESDVDLMAAIGWNTVRLLVSWSRLEPRPGEYDEAYLDEAETAVRLLARRGLYSVIDLHQDAWGATLAARPDEVCTAPAEPAFGWDGAPGWATLDGGAPRCAASGVRETSPAVGAAFTAFWDDAPGPDGVGIRTRYARMLGHVAARFAAEPAVAGYDLMNEPNAFSSAQQAALADLYSGALAEIRTAERAAAGFSHLVFFEPSVLWSALGSGPPPDFERDRDVVYAPHIYTGGFSGGPITRAAFAVARDEAVGFGGAPVFSGEWGADPGRAEDPSDGYFAEHQELQDEFRFGATLWTWRESCGDPHKAGDYRAGRVPIVWGEFDVDCTTNEVRGERRALVEELTRPVVRAAPGRIDKVTYDPNTGGFLLTAGMASADGRVVVFYPASRHGGPLVEFTGLEDISVLDAPGGNAYLVGRAVGGEWSLGVQPEGAVEEP